VLRVANGAAQGSVSTVRRFEDQGVDALGFAGETFYYLASGRPASLYTASYEPGTFEFETPVRISAPVRENGVDWSPDGKLLAFGRAGEPMTRSVLVIRDLDSGREREMTLELLGEPSAIRWSPGGDTILVTAGAYHNLLGVDSGRMTRIATTERTASAAEWSVDGKKVHYGLGDSINAYDASSGSRGERRYLSAPGRSIQFSTKTGMVAWTESVSSAARIWLEPVAGGPSRTVSLSPSNCVAVGWLALNLFVACAAATGDPSSSLHLLNTESGAARRLTLPIPAIQAVRANPKRPVVAVVGGRTTGGVYGIRDLAR